ncbi:hypothetical protein jhhlp_003133 [Lomentospora prolificans]|uniref:Uncharacterized protein n=1 Tax=Lomentospora prolificans TaxID=41688 RepID=A0A2N3NG37_9PEZI|nr:hypothetical protein jhhlp_003133 [Lomentospora prolificans]
MDGKYYSSSERRSKAIPIIHPSSRQEKHPGRRPYKANTVESYSLGVDPPPKSSPHKTTQRQGPHGNNSVERDDEIIRGFDVYATPFVPESLRLLNYAPGIEILTPAKRQIDWASCTCISFESGLRISLSHPPLPTGPGHGLPISPPTDIELETYAPYFTQHLMQELFSQRRLARVYALYNQRVTVRVAEGETMATCTLMVPGLKENAPFLEEDDLVELRQLVYEHYGGPSGMDECVESIKTGAKAISPIRGAPGWTGVIYRARVAAVKRADELITLRVAGLMTDYGGGDSWPLPLAEREVLVNVQFPVCTRKHEDMSLALQITQGVLVQNTNGHGPSVQKGPVYDCTWLRSMLFPTEDDGALQTKLHRGKFRQQFVDDQLNWEQRKAVQAICQRNYGTMPYLVSGPPGTGKTKTVIETAVQLLKQSQRDTHILLCAPSENAADTLAIRLRDHLQPGELFRMNRPTRTFAEVPSSILHLCYTCDNAFALPPLDELLKCKVVVTSCQDAALLIRARATNMDIYRMKQDLQNMLIKGHENDLPMLHWTALLIDEAAQAMEPETLIPLTVVAPPMTAEPTPIFAMVGDQFQLSPSTSLAFSPLKRSLFARLFDRPVYKNHPLARGAKGEAPPILKPSMLPIPAPPFTNLFRNYRSHPAILAVPSALFYHDTLEPEAGDVDQLHDWDCWKGRKWPVLFHDNQGYDELEKDGGGWYNVNEVNTALRYVSSLSASGLVKRKDICVMSPFKAQVMRLRQEFRRGADSLWEVNVGPTEAFQGLEYDVVILCTTRTRERFLKKDQEVGWGIIGSANAMNVAITRARYGLIVIGNWELLTTDPNWNSFLHFCHRNGLVFSESENGTTDNRRVDEQAWETGKNMVDARSGPKVRLTAEFTRLEKMLLAQETELEAPIGSRALGGVDMEDEMWMKERHDVPKDYLEEDV